MLVFEVCVFTIQSIGHETQEKENNYIQAANVRGTSDDVVGSTDKLAKNYVSEKMPSLKSEKIPFTSDAT